MKTADVLMDLWQKDSDKNKVALLKEQSDGSLILEGVYDKSEVTTRADDIHGFNCHGTFIKDHNVVIISDAIEGFDGIKKDKE